MGKLILAISLHILLLSALKFTAWPEDLLWPYLNLHGLNYYREIFLLYPPLYWLSLTVFLKLAGLSILSLKIATYAVVIATDLLLWRAASRKLLPVLFYIPLQIFFEGNGLWVDQLLAPLLLAAYLFYQRRSFFFSGVFLGLALMSKQTALYFLMVTGLMLLSAKPFALSWFKFLGGLFFTLLVIIGYLAFNRELAGFFDNAVIYVLFFLSRQPLRVQWPSPGQALTVLIVVLPVVLTFWKRSNRSLALLTVSAALGAFNRFEYFHLQPALPFLALYYNKNRRAAFPLYALFLLLFLRFFLFNWGMENRFFTADITANAKKLTTYLKPGEQTLIINTWDHYYFLTQTRPLNRYFVPSTPWSLDYDAIQEKIAKGIRRCRPPTIVYNPCFAVGKSCYFPAAVDKEIRENYREVSKLADGTGIFQYNPMGLPQKVQTENCQ